MLTPHSLVVPAMDHGIFPTISDVRRILLQGDGDIYRMAFMAGRLTTGFSSFLYSMIHENFK